jgi:hypothetical protein
MKGDLWQLSVVAKCRPYTELKKMLGFTAEAKSKVPDWGIKLTLA